MQRVKWMKLKSFNILSREMLLKQKRATCTCTTQRRGSKAVCRHAKVQAHLWAPITFPSFSLCVRLCVRMADAFQFGRRQELTLSNCMVSLPQKGYWETKREKQMKRSSPCNKYNLALDLEYIFFYEWCEILLKEKKKKKKEKDY